MVAYKRWGSEDSYKSYTVTDLNNLYVKFHQEAEKNPYWRARRGNGSKNLRLETLKRGNFGSASRILV